MASIRTRTLKSGKRAYLVRWAGPDGKEAAEQYPTKEAAKNRKTEIENQLRTGTYIDPNAGKTTFKEYAENWRALQVHRPSTVTRVESELRIHVYPVIGKRSLASLRRSDIQSLVRRIDRGPGTVANVYATVSSVLHAAALDRIIPESPCRRIALPRAPKRDVVIPDDPFALARDMPEWIQRAVLVATGTGLRQGEIGGLAVESVDFLRRMLYVDPDVGQLVDPASGTPYLGPPKTPASAREIPLASWVVNLLSEQIAEKGTLEHQGRHLIFQNSRGGLLVGQSITRAIRPALTRAGYPPRVGLHLFRHFYASALIAKSKNPKLVQARMGHATIAETYDTYGHLMPDSEDLSRQAIEDVLPTAQRANLADS